MTFYGSAGRLRFWRERLESDLSQALCRAAQRGYEISSPNDRQLAYSKPSKRSFFDQAAAIINLPEIIANGRITPAEDIQRAFMEAGGAICLSMADYAKRNDLPEPQQLELELRDA